MLNSTAVLNDMSFHSHKVHVVTDKSVLSPSYLLGLQRKAIAYAAFD